MPSDAEHVPMAVRVDTVLPREAAVERVVGCGASVGVHPEDLPEEAHPVLRKGRVRILADDGPELSVRAKCDDAAVVIRRAAQWRHRQDDAVEGSHVSARGDAYDAIVDRRSEEHTSELQSRGHLVCR